MSLRGEEPGVRMTLRFDGQEISGRAACNRYGAGYEATTADGDIEIKAISLTKMACAGNRGELESRYVGALADVAAYRAADGRLELLDGDGRALLVYEKARKGVEKG